MRLRNPQPATSHLKPTKAANNSNNSAGCGKPAEKVLIGGDVYLYQVKAPFEPSGKSIKGALEYDEAEDRVKCHECGEWHKGLGNHIRKAHGTSTKAYRKRHGLGSKTSLLAEGTRQLIGSIRQKKGHGAWLNSPQITKRRLLAVKKSFLQRRQSHATIEFRNKRGMCPAQILEKIKRLAVQVGRTPTSSEMYEAGISLNSMRFIYGTVNEAVKLAGLKPNKQCVTVNSYSNETLLEMLRIFYRLNGRQPRKTDFGRYGLPSDCTFRYHFGTMKKAWAKAGLPGWKNYPYRIRTFERETIPVAFATEAGI